jgi:hypothetical protein
MMARLVVLFLLLRIPLFGNVEQDITEVVSNLASAVSGNQPRLFLKILDRDMPGYRELERSLTALAGDTEINCSIDLIGNTGSPTAQQVDLDWYMVLRSQQDQNLIERRRTKVTIKMEKRGKNWVVTAFNPISIFAPMTAR